MSVVGYGPTRPKFAWWPVDTRDEGWKWMRVVYRHRVYMDLPGAPAPFWEYFTRRPSK